MEFWSSEKAVNPFGDRINTLAAIELRGVFSFDARQDIIVLLSIVRKLNLLKNWPSPTNRVTAVALSQPWNMLPRLLVAALQTWTRNTIPKNLCLRRSLPDTNARARERQIREALDRSPYTNYAVMYNQVGYLTTRRPPLKLEDIQQWQLLGNNPQDGGFCSRL